MRFSATPSRATTLQFYHIFHGHFQKSICLATRCYSDVLLRFARHSRNMDVSFILNLLLLSSSFCSASIVRFADKEVSHAPPQARAQPVGAPLSHDIFNTSSLNILPLPNNSSKASLLVESELGVAYGVICDARKYGGGLTATSCFSAVRQGPNGATQETWGYAPYVQVDVYLPVKLFGGEWAHILA